MFNVIEWLLNRLFPEKKDQFVPTVAVNVTQKQTVKKATTRKPVVKKPAVKKAVAKKKPAVKKAKK